MSKSLVDQQSIITIEPKAYVEAVYESFQDTLTKAVTTYGKATYNISTKSGMETAKEARAAFREIRIGGNKEREARKAPLIEIGKLLDSRYKEIAAQVAPYEERFDADIKAEEKKIEDEKAAKIKAEAERANAIQVLIDDIRNAPLAAIPLSVIETNEIISELTGIVPNYDVYGERFVEAELLLTTTIASLTEMLKGKEAQEIILKQQEEKRIEDERLAAIAEQERIAIDARIRAEQEAEVQRIKEAQEDIERQRAELAAQQAAIDAHNKKIESDAIAKAEAEAKAKRIQDDLDRAKQGVRENEIKQEEVETKPATTSNDSTQDIVQDDAHVSKAAGSSKQVVNLLSGITDEQVITSLADEFDITFGQSCDLIMRVADQLRVAA